jgi:HD-GYP domain-containing protein (c-di-GMP phosphodiesterase class II)
VAHAIVVDGHRSSVRIERRIWDALRRISHERRMTLKDLISEINGTRAGPGLSAAIRTYVVLYLSGVVWRSGANGPKLPRDRRTVLPRAIDGAEASLSTAPTEIADSVKLDALKKIEAMRGSALSRHESSVAAACEILCKAAGLDDYLIMPMKLAAELHDIGKIGIGDELLNKPTALTVDEMAVMRTHSLIGYAILSGSAERAFDCAANAAYAHHEAFDGSGYPLGLKGDGIPLSGRIVALCDVYDSLRSDRPYRTAMPHIEAMSVMTSKRGRASVQKFDPQLLRVFISCANAIAAIYDNTEPGRIDI